MRGKIVRNNIARAEILDFDTLDEAKILQTSALLAVGLHPISQLIESKIDGDNYFQPDVMLFVDGIFAKFFCRDLRSCKRIRGVDVMRVFLFERFRGSKHFFFGGEMSDVTILLNMCKGEQIAADGCCPPYLPVSQLCCDKYLNRIRAFAPDFVWVGLGCPKQDNFIAQAKIYFPDTLFVGVGAAFGFMSGGVRPCPSVVSNFGLEWFWRCFSEPKKIAPRIFSSIRVVFCDYVRGMFD